MPRLARLMAFGMLLIGLLFPLAAYAQDSGPVYVVQPGDTLSAIARRFGVSQEALAQANGISDPSRLFPGDELVLPGFPGLAGELALYPLRLGETIQSLSAQHSLDPLALARLNRMVRLDGGYVGQTLIVPVTPEPEATAVFEVTGITQRGETRLERSLAEGISPWQRRTTDPDPFRRWLLPGFPLYDGVDGGLAHTGLLSELTITPGPLVQGKTAVLRLKEQVGLSVTGRLGEYPLEFFPTGDGYVVALQGVHALEEPGLLDFSIELLPEVGGAPVFGFHQRLLLNSGDYGFQNLTGVPPQTVDPAYTKPEDDLIRELLAPKSEQRLWDDRFDFPSRYYTEEFVSFFGTRRNYNSGSLLYYHTGLDFYGQNNPIYAPAAGVVVFADSLTVRGNTTYIDHGWGVYSGYLHQNELYVQVGDRVERGQVIGQVGATGRVTGPHLHWEIWVGGVPVEPLDWVTETIP